MSKKRESLERLRDLPDHELGQALERAQDELFRLKLGLYTNQVENTSQVKDKRREVARILTLISARATGRETQAQGTAAAAEGKEG